MFFVLLIAFLLLVFIDKVINDFEKKNGKKIDIVPRILSHRYSVDNDHDENKESQNDNEKRENRHSGMIRRKTTNIVSYEKKKEI